MKVRKFPKGMEPGTFHDAAMASTTSVSTELSLPNDDDHKIVVGVDRLDYTEGIPERLKAFGECWTAMQTCAVESHWSRSPSRHVPAFVNTLKNERKWNVWSGRSMADTLMQDGVPIRYLYRFFPQTQLARFYHDSHVGMITPLRDGMNIIAKEYITAHGEDPGVLALSKFSGAAVELTEATQVNPYDTDGTAEQLYQALRMPHTERVRRWRSQMNAVTENTARAWGENFFQELQLP